MDSKTYVIGYQRTNHYDGECQRNTKMCGVPIEGEVGEESQFSGEQNLALAYYLVPRMETVSGVSSPTRSVSIINQISNSCSKLILPYT